MSLARIGIMRQLISPIQSILPYLVATAVMVLAVIAAKMARRPAVRKGGQLSYVKNREILSAAERSLFRLLEQAAGENYRVLAKIRAGEIITINPLPDQSASLGAMEQVNSRKFDFVLCDKEYLAPVCALKVAYASKEEYEPDPFLERVCKAIGLPLVHIMAPTDLSASELRKKLQPAIKGSSAAGNPPAEKPFTVGAIASAASKDRPWTIDGLFSDDAGDRLHKTF
jgi:hypothetical protein